MELKELRRLDSPALKKLLAEERERLRDLRFRVAAGQYKDVREIRAARLLVARLLTLLRAKHTPL